MSFAGIDVGSQELILVIRKHGKARKSRAFGNTPRDHQAIAEALRKAR